MKLTTLMFTLCRFYTFIALIRLNQSFHNK